jgi:hypothetical protein
VGPGHENVLRYRVEKVGESAVPGGGDDREE